MTDARGTDPDANGENRGAGGEDRDTGHDVDDTGRDDHDADYDVVIVGGGPAGSSAGVFAGRYGLETAIFDCGRSSLKQCAYLENYLGFPAGVDVETLYDLMADHAATAGCEIVNELVTTVERREKEEKKKGESKEDEEEKKKGESKEDEEEKKKGEEGEGDTIEKEGEKGGFVVSTQDDRRVTARRVVAATRYDGSYLRPLDGEAMFDRVERDGEAHERFDRAYADRDGRTPIGGLYVASPSHEADRQAIVAAGRGARVGIAVVEDARRARGYPDAVSDRYDWVRRDVQRDDEWRDRDRWRERYAERVPDDYVLDDGTLGALLEREIDRRLDSYLTPEEIETRTECGQRRLLEHLDDGLVLDRAHEIRAESLREEVSD